jgi:hypothetical protein
MNQAPSMGFPHNDKFWIGTYFQHIPNGMYIYEIPADKNTLCIKFNTRDVIVNNKRKRFARPKRRMIYFFIHQAIYANYLKNYKGKEPFSQSPPTEELIQLGFDTQTPL